MANSTPAASQEGSHDGISAEEIQVRPNATPDRENKLRDGDTPADTARDRKAHSGKKRRDGTDSDTVSWTCHNPLKLQRMRAYEIIEAINKRELLDLCLEKRGMPDLDCTFPRRWAMGSRNLIIEVNFSDGVRWVVKIYMLSLESPVGSINGIQSPNIGSEDDRAVGCESDSDWSSDSDEDPLECLRAEFEAMEFIRTYTEIPVATPHFVQELETSLGTTACIAMDFVGGIQGSEFFGSELLDAPPEQKVHYRMVQDRIIQSMAEVQLGLAQFQSPVGGVLRRYKERDSVRQWLIKDDFGVVEDPTQRIKIYRTPVEYYQDAIRRRADDIEDCEECQWVKSSQKILEIVDANLLQLCSKKKVFYLAAIDLGGHNSIFDHDGRLQAIIDIDSLRFVPIEVAVQLPAQFGLYHYPVNDSWVWLADETPYCCPLLYAAKMYQAGKKHGLPELGSYLSGQAVSKTAFLVDGLYVIDEESTISNNFWLQSDRAAEYSLSDAAEEDIPSSSPWIFPDPMEPPEEDQLEIDIISLAMSRLTHHVRPESVEASINALDLRLPAGYASIPVLRQSDETFHSERLQG